MLRHGKYLHHMTIGVREIPSRMIGECIMDELKQIDQVAYVRFASVYREFRLIVCTHEKAQ